MPVADGFSGNIFLKSSGEGLAFYQLWADSRKSQRRNYLQDSSATTAGAAKGYEEGFSINSEEWAELLS